MIIRTITLFLQIAEGAVLFWVSSKQQPYYLGLVLGPGFLWKLPFRAHDHDDVVTLLKIIQKEPTWTAK